MKIKVSNWSMVILLLSVMLLSCSKGTETPPPPAGPDTSLQGYLDIVTYEKNHFYATGWAADKEDNAPVKKVMVYLDGKLLGEAELGKEREDVAKVTQNSNWVKSGWVINRKITLDKGAHTVYAVGVNKHGARVKLTNEKNFTVQ
ncbi:MAG: hypothetical protein V2B13_13985 [Pseudomonadota bacterium]